MASEMTTDIVNQKVLKSSVICTTVYTVIALTVGFLTSSQVILFDGIYNMVGIGLTYLSILSMKFINKPDTSNYPFGKEAFEPFIALIQYGIILYLCVSNMVTAVNTILHGGHLMDLTSGIAFGVLGSAFNISVFVYLKMLTKKYSSAISEVEIDQWKFSVFLSIGILTGFTLSWLLNFTQWGIYTAYVDPLLTILITILFGHTAVVSIKGCIRELLGGKPSPEVVSLIEKQIEQACQASQFKERILRFGKVGSKVIVEIDYVIEEGSPLDSVAQQDKIRRQLMEGLGELPYSTWVNVGFVSDQKLCEHYI